MKKRNIVILVIDAVLATVLLSMVFAPITTDPDTQYNENLYSDRVYAQGMGLVDFPTDYEALKKAIRH